ncbi:MAG: hypothetical protein QHH15_03905 [Candidatus Thermoplasmatota archaeon]|jgi:magnesium-transporting ATPase (P-type)/predicted RNA-binding Zn-ribbon protein involved in translation (DUF1610 family)|nr:hypothetical protein [Candidatus Thermoplasmatota archaeon]
MSIEINNTFKKLSSRLLFLGILTLLIILVIPWISIVDHDSQELVFFNSLMMERSENSTIKDYAYYIVLIIFLLSVIIFVNLISYVCFNIYSSEKYPRFIKILTNTFYISLIVSTLITYLQINLIKKIAQTDNVSLASIFSIIKFAYVPLAISFLLLIFSVTYTSSVIKYALKYGRTTKKTEKIVKKEPIPEKIISDFKYLKGRDWLDYGEKQKTYTAFEPDSEFSKSSEPFKRKNNFIKSDEKNNLGPFYFKKSETDLKESSEKLEKNHDKVNLNIPSAIVKKKVNIRCPKCKFVFSVEKDENIIKVKCPKCGKEGVIKYLNKT